MMKGGRVGDPSSRDLPETARMTQYRLRQNTWLDRSCDRADPFPWHARTDSWAIIPNSRSDSRLAAIVAKRETLAQCA